MPFNDDARRLAKGRQCRCPRLIRIRVRLMDSRFRERPAVRGNRRSGRPRRRCRGADGGDADRAVAAEEVGLALGGLAGIGGLAHGGCSSRVILHQGCARRPEPDRNRGFRWRSGVQELSSFPSLLVERSKALITPVVREIA